MDSLHLVAFAATGTLAGVFAGLLGIGGGSIIVPALILLLAQMGMDDAWISHQAVATSLATVVATGAVSAWSHHRRGAVRWVLFARLAVAMLLGAWMGALFAGSLSGEWLQRLFGLFLLYNGFRMLRAASVVAERPLPGFMSLGAAGTGFGALSALFGIGGGVLVVPFLARHGVRMQQAVATASACGVPMALVGSLGFMLSGWGREGLPEGSLGFVYGPAALAIMLTSLPAATLGVRLAHRLDTRMLKRVFGVYLLLAGAALLLQ